MRRKINETKKVTLLFSDCINKDRSNLADLRKWLEVEDEDIDCEYEDSYEKEIIVKLKGVVESGACEIDVDHEDDSMPNSVCEMLDDIAEDNEYWV